MRIAAFLFALLWMAVPLAGCGSSDADVPSTSSGETTSESETTEVIESSSQTETTPSESVDNRPRGVIVCEKLEECGYTDLIAFPGFTPETCPANIEQLSAFGFEAALICMLEAEECLDLPACDPSGGQILPPLDGECVQTCRDLGAKLEECGPPIQTDLYHAVGGIHRLNAEENGWAFELAEEAYREVRELLQHHADGFRVVETPRMHILTLDGAVPGSLINLVRGHEGLLEEHRVWRDRDGHRVVTTGRALTRFAPGSETEHEKLIGSYGFEVEGRIGFGEAGYRIRHRGESADFLSDLLRLHSDKDVRWAEPDLLREYEARRFEQQWHLRNHDSPNAGKARDSGVNVQLAWELTRGESDVVVAINDDGVDFLHPNLAPGAVEGLYLPDDLDAALSGCCSHGTAVAGVAVARPQGPNDISGVCPECALMPMFAEILGFNQSDENVANSFTDAADAGAWVHNNSWGLPTGNVDHFGEGGPIPGIGGGGGPGVMPSIVNEALNEVAENGRDGLGMVVVFASGNSNSPGDYFSNHPTTISVGSVSDLAIKSFYSSIGEQLDVVAPSDGGISGITTADARGDAGYVRGGEITATFGGTSSASPFAAGLIGLVLSANPDLTAAEVREILHGTSQKIDRIRGGYDEDGHSQAYGYGRVDAYQAVRAALALVEGEDCIALDNELHNGVDDTCSGTVDEGFEPLESCAICTVDAQCGEDAVCTRIPNDPEPRCLETCTEASDCDDADATCEAGVCVPEFARCEPCADEESCNGLDDTCSGVADRFGENNSENACTVAPNAPCRYDAQCGDGQLCAGQTCYAICENDNECDPADNAECVMAKDRYGAERGQNICVPGLAETCVFQLCRLEQGIDTSEEGRALRDCLGVAGDDCERVYDCRP